MLALADRRSREQVEADAEIERTSRDEQDELVRALQDALAACGTFADLWMRRNNLPTPPCPGCLEREFASRDLVAEESVKVISHERLLATRRRRADRLILAVELQPLLL